MSGTWFYAIDGRPAYVQKGKHIYNAEGAHKFVVENGWWQEPKSGNPVYFTKDEWIYSKDGEPAFFSLDRDASGRPE